MGSTERRERERDERRRSILTAAEGLFLEKGYSAVTLDELAAHCELAKGTLYLYFPSKADMLGSIALATIQDLGDRFQRVLETCQDPASCLGQMGQQYMEYHHATRERSGLVELAGSRAIQEQLSPDLQAAWGRESGRSITQLAQALGGCRAAGLLVEDLDPLEFALVLAGCSMGLIEIAGQCQGMLPLEPAQFVERGWSLLLSAVSAPGVDLSRSMKDGGPE